MTNKGFVAGSVEDVCISDHKPVFAGFEVGVAANTVSIPSCTPTSCEQLPTRIVFGDVTARVYTNSKDLLSVEIHSTILESKADHCRAVRLIRACLVALQVSKVIARDYYS